MGNSRIFGLGRRVGLAGLVGVLAASCSLAVPGPAESGADAAVADATPGTDAVPAPIDAAVGDAKPDGAAALDATTDATAHDAKPDALPDAADASDAATPCGATATRLCGLGEACADPGDCVPQSACVANVCELTPCPRGTYHDPPGSTTCTPCADDFSTPATGSVRADCAACVPPQTSSAATRHLCVVPATAIATGKGHTCAVLSDGTLKCWGYNGFGQLGDGTTTRRSAPVPVLGLAGAASAVGGAFHTCALLTGGDVKCWGRNAYGMIGDGTTDDRTTPVSVALGGAASAIAVGAMHTCALLTDGTVKCWGLNTSGQLGSGIPPTQRDTPTAVLGLGDTVLSIAAGATHTCAVMRDRSVKCWGENRYGSIGDGTTTSRSTPVAVTGLGGTALSISAALDHTCAVLSDGTVKCWGDNGRGQLGNGGTGQRTTPVSVSGLGGTALSVSTGDWHTCALLTGGTLECWGGLAGSGLGDGTTAGRLTPMPVLDLGGTAIAVAAGSSTSSFVSFHTCALLEGGTVKCWGNNANGQVGDDTTVNRLLPVPVVGLP